MLTSRFVARALKLINVPGRGSDLAPEDQDDALEALQEILNSEAVSKKFVPGIRRHFFPMQQGKAIYSYGADPAFDLRSDDFDDDPPPIKIEDAYIREGSTVTNNERIDEYRFENVGPWVVDADIDARIFNNQYLVETPAAATSTTQPLATVAGLTYRLRVNVEIVAGTVEIRFRDSAVTFETFILDASGGFFFDFLWPTNVAPDIEIATLLATDDIKINTLSLIERDKERLELPDSRGSDYGITIVDQTHYNRRFTKGTGGRPYEILYSRGFGDDKTRAEIRFDNSAVAGDILVMDVLCNRVQVNNINDVMRIQPEAFLWLRYKLADVMAGEYGKSLTARQVTTMEDAQNKLFIGNRRMNMLGVDRALRERPTFDISRGDP